MCVCVKEREIMCVCVRESNDRWVERVFENIKIHKYHLSLTHSLTISPTPSLTLSPSHCVYLFLIELWNLSAHCCRERSFRSGQTFDWKELWCQCKEQSKSQSVVPLFMNAFFLFYCLFLLLSFSFYQWLMLSSFFIFSIHVEILLFLFLWMLYKSYF